MKHLKKFFESNSLYELFDDDLQSLNLKYEPFNDFETSKILNSLVKPWIKTSGVFLEAKNSAIKLVNIDEEFYVTILKTEDEWFYVVLDNSIEVETYKCDQFEGVLQLLKFNKVIE